jgi:hypothetical protein
VIEEGGAHFSGVTVAKLDMTSSFRSQHLVLARFI